MSLKPRSEYANALKRELAERGFFRAQPSRILYALLHGSLLVASVTGIQRFGSLPAKFAFSLLLGHSIGCLAFAGHEILHGSVIRNRMGRLVLGGICFLPWGMLPRIWIRWHNQLHHNHTNDPFQDPDCWGREISYRHSRMARFIETFSPGSGRAGSSLFLFAFFTFKVFFMIFLYPGFHRTRKGKGIAGAYFISIQAGWLLCAASAGWKGILFLFAFPLASANFLVMSYIITNHSLNRLTEKENDCLANSLTVRCPAFIEWLHMNFNFHAEHHLFPSISPRFAKAIHRKAVENWGDRYAQMPHWRALLLIYRTPRFYKDDRTLSNPRNGRTAETIT